MRVTDLVQYIKQEIPSLDGVIKTGSIDKSATQSIGVYKKGSATPYIAVGGVPNTSYGTIPITILVHWTENATTCEEKAQEIYDLLYGLVGVSMNGVMVHYANMLDPDPIDVGRDDKNISEFVVKLNIVYER